MEDLISVIIPIYRVEAYLEQCIQSVRNQTYKNLEIILVDDGSDDQCPQICDRNAQEDERIKVIHKENGGLDSARKAGILASTGKYVGYVDGDDWVEPEMYEKLIEYAQVYDVDVVESGAIDTGITEHKKRVPYLDEGCYKGRDFLEKVEPRLLYAGTFFEHGISPYMWSKLFLRDKLMKYQMMPGVVNKTHVDIMVSLPCIAETKSVYITHHSYYHYRIRTDSLKRECRKEEIRYLFEGYPEFYLRFKGTKLCSSNDMQIKYYAMYWLLFRAPYAFDNSDEDILLTQFGGIKSGASIVLYGAGGAGIHLENYIRRLNKFNVVCWVDRNYETLREALDVVSPNEIIDKKYDYVVISILRETAVESVRRDLEKMQVPKEKILWIEQKYINNPELLLDKVVYRGKTLFSR